MKQIEIPSISHINGMGQNNLLVALPLHHITFMKGKATSHLYADYPA